MKSTFLTFYLLFSGCLVAQTSSLSDMLWEEAGGRINTSADRGGEYDIIDEAAKGYLKIAFTEEGCGCYSETAVGAFKDKRGEYTTLKMHWNACENEKTLLPNKPFARVLPIDFGLHTFVHKSKETEYQITAAVFYLEAEIPREGTDTQINLNYIPFGIHMSPEDHVLAYAYKEVTEHGGSNFLYSGALQGMLRQISNENTLECILEKTLDSIKPEDRKLVDKIYGKGKAFSGIQELAAQIRQLKTIYEISKDIEYKAVILGWNRENARFYIKEKIKNDAPEMTFLEFIRQLPFLLATC